MEPTRRRTASDGDDDLPEDTSATDPGSVPTDQLGLGLPAPPGVGERLADVLARLDQVRDRPALALLVALVVVAALAAAATLRTSPPPSNVDAFVPRVGLTPTSAPTTTAADVVVHVSGAVVSPGLYRLPATARVGEAVEAAGGATPAADLHQLNLAAVVADGQQVRVPLEGETLPLPSATDGTTGPIDLNRADAVALQTLPGVGPATAEAIIAFREEHGPFRTVDDLLDVPGIGPAKLAAIADAVVVR